MFVHFRNQIWNTNQIKYIDTTKYVKQGLIIIHLNDGEWIHVEDAEALNIIQTLCPAVLEGKRAKYVRHAWAVHNLIGHPLMQIFSWLHLPSLGVKIHDATIPDPKEE